MATPPPSNQIFRVQGELHVIGTTTNATSSLWNSQGIIKMLSPTGTFLGSIRGLATSVYRAMLVDTTGMFAGFAVKTQTTQGPTTIGGNNDKYAFQCVGQTSTAQYLTCITDRTYNNIVQEVGTPLFTARRYQTGASTGAGASSAIASLTQDVLKTNENICLQIGLQDASLLGALGYNQNGTLWLGWRPNNLTSAPSKYLTMNQTGNVDIPIRLDVGTISATTYLNLPPSDILPITLDKTGFRVGINNTNPSKDLDVTGDVHVSDHLTVDGSITGQLTTAVQPGITGVGVLAGLNVSGTVDITGDVTASGNVQVNGTIRSDIGIYPTGIANSVIQSGSGSPEGVKTAIPGSLFLRTDGAVGNQLYTKVTGTGNTGWNVVGGNSALSFQMPADVTYSGNVALMSFTLPTAGTWQLTISLRSTPGANIIFYISDVAADTSISIPNKIRCTLLYSGSNLSPSHGVFTYTTTVNSQTVYLNVVGSGSTTYHSNSGYVYALKLV